MGIFEKLKAELVDIIEWMDDSRTTIVWRFPRYLNQIKHGAQLIVRPGQTAVFVDRGKLGDVFEPGTYTLETKNLPILSTLQGWKYGFDSPFKAEVYFVSTRQITELKWGTPNPIIMRDADFGPVRVRAFGTYSLRAIDAKALLKELVGTDSVFETDEVNELLRSIINTAFADVLGKANIPVLDLAARYQQLSDELRKLVCERIDDEYGLDIPQLNIVNVSLPPEVEKAIDTRSSMGVLGDMQRYTQYQVATSMPMAAANPGGGFAAAGMGLGLGAAAGATLSQQMMPPPPPPPQATLFHLAVNGQTVGPYEGQQLSAAVSQGQLTSTTLVWAHGMSGWVPAGTVPALAHLFAAPPPPPKA